MKTTIEQLNKALNNCAEEMIPYFTVVSGSGERIIKDIILEHFTPIFDDLIKRINTEEESRNKNNEEMKLLLSKIDALKSLVNLSDGRGSMGLG